jgi:hypothetical protein
VGDVDGRGWLRHVWSGRFWHDRRWRERSNSAADRHELFCGWRSEVGEDGLEPSTQFCFCFYTALSHLKLQVVQEHQQLMSKNSEITPESAKLSGAQCNAICNSMFFKEVQS